MKDRILTDSEGYPTEETLNYITHYDLTIYDVHELMRLIEEIWMYEDYFTVVKKRNTIEYHLSTGGWSGNEDIIDALQNNEPFWWQYWYQSNRGGHYIFKIKKQ